MARLVSLIFILTSIIFAEDSNAADGSPTNAAQCTGANNPLQVAKDLLGSAQMALRETSQQLDAKKIDDAKKHGAKAADLIESARKQVQSHYRSLPSTWLSNFTAFTTDLTAAKKPSDALKTRVTTLLKSLDDVVESMSCPRILEPVYVELLPPEPNGKDFAKKSANYKVYALGINGKAQLVKEWTDRPFGDCKGCTRGLSLNCHERTKSQTAKETLVKSPDKSTDKIDNDACSNGLADGIGIRLVMKDKKLDVDVKNVSKYTVTQQFNALEKILPPTGDDHIVQLFILKQSTIPVPENLIYQVVMSVH